MLQIKNRIPIILCMVSMLFLIIDGRTAVIGAQDGIALCIESVIPSLFPFVVLTSYLTGVFSSFSLPFIRWIFPVPNHIQGIIISGLIGGYPVGAQCVSNARHMKQLSQKDAVYLLSFCNQAGPSFIFGILAAHFPNLLYVWGLWIIQIVSAALVSRSQYHDFSQNNTELNMRASSLSDAVKKAVVSMGFICGWIVLFRVYINIAEKWLFNYFPDIIKPIVCGILELTNGVLLLSEMNHTKYKFIIASMLLSGGGLCVAMQTSAVIYGLPLKSYLKGKLLQILYSCLISSGLIHLIQPKSVIDIIKATSCLYFAFLLPVWLRKTQKRVASARRMLYNGSTLGKKDSICCSERKSNVTAHTVSMVRN